MILRHEDVRNAARDWRRFSSDAPFRVPIPSEESVRGMRQLPIETDHPAHGEYREIVEPFFQRAKQPEIMEKVDSLIGGLLAAAGRTGVHRIPQGHPGQSPRPIDSRAKARVSGILPGALARIAPLAILIGLLSTSCAHTSPLLIRQSPSATVRLARRSRRSFASPSSPFSPNPDSATPSATPPRCSKPCPGQNPSSWLTPPTATSNPIRLLFAIVSPAPNPIPTVSPKSTPTSSATRAIF